MRIESVQARDRMKSAKHGALRVLVVGLLSCAAIGVPSNRALAFPPGIDGMPSGPTCPPPLHVARIVLFECVFDGPTGHPALPTELEWRRSPDDVTSVRNRIDRLLGVNAHVRGTVGLFAVLSAQGTRVGVGGSAEIQLLPEGPGRDGILVRWCSDDGRAWRERVLTPREDTLALFEMEVDERRLVLALSVVPFAADLLGESQRRFIRNLRRQPKDVSIRLEPRTLPTSVVGREPADDEVP